ncbi:MAG TPA: hypothetical protein VFY01_03025, partial [Rheinheimera sp.]|nr:hypothetical protein [Rheinheimera sp.]
MKKLIRYGLAIALMSGSFHLQAALAEGNALCDILDVQVTSYQKQDGSAAVSLDPALPASACLGAYSGNLNTSSLGNNLGYDGQGYLNDKSLFPDYGAFLAEDELQDLEIAGNFKDPGWIFVGKQDMGSGFESGTVTKGGESYTFASDILTMQNCKDKDGNAHSCDEDAVSGEWVYKPPQFNPEQLLDLLGMDKFFDQAAIVFKSGTQLAIYNFRLSDFGLPPVLGTDDANYIFTGTWDMSDTLIMDKKCKKDEEGP